MAQSSEQNGISDRALHRALTRRGAVVGSAKLALGGALSLAAMSRVAPVAFAQATPAAADRFAAYPEIKVTLTDRALTASTNTVPAGYVLLTVVNQSTQTTSAGVLGPGPGQTMADLQAAAATPVPNNGFPPFFYTAAILGGPGDTPAGGTGRAVLKIPAGDWVIFPEGNQAPAFFTAAAGGRAQPEPASAVQAVEVNYAFGFTREGIKAGKQVWKVTNEGTDPHMLVMGAVPAGATFAQVVQVASLPSNATPSPGMLQPSDFRNVGGVILQSPGQVVWTELDLAAGRYAAVCFVPEQDNPQMAHVMEGMIALFDVA